MCIDMFQNSRINIILRIVCLLTFIMVIIFSNSFITLSLLTVYFYLFTRNDHLPFVILWRIITIIVFLICCFTNNLYLLKIVLCLGLAYYFLINPYGNIDDEIEEKVELDKYIIRFKKIKIIRKEAINRNMIHTIYITVHLFILFITIVVG